MIRIKSNIAPLAASSQARGFGIFDHNTPGLLLVKRWFIAGIVAIVIPCLAMATGAGHRYMPLNHFDRVYDEEHYASGGLQFSYGLNAGVYFANDATANYYNGSGRNNLEKAIGKEHNIHNYNRIREALGGYDFEFPGEPHDYLPQSMSYSPSMAVGVFGMLHFNQRISLHSEFNFSRLRLQDQFSLRIKRGDPGFIGHDIERFNIIGSEERSDIKLGLQFIHRSTRNEVHPYFEFGLNMISTRVRENRVQIAGNSYSILNLTDRRYGFRDDGISFGTYAGGGLMIDIGRSNALAIGATANYASINLGDYKNRYHMNYSFFLRLYLTAGSEISATD